MPSEMPLDAGHPSSTHVIQNVRIIDKFLQHRPNL